MKTLPTIIHQVCNDLRYIRLGIFVLAALGIFFISLELREFNSFTNNDQSWAWILWISIIGLSTILMMIVVQKDNPINTRSFWSTRPISRPLMFASKIAVLAITSFILLIIYLLPPVLSNTFMMIPVYSWDFIYRSLPFLIMGTLLGSLGRGINESLIKGVFLFLVAVFALYLLHPLAEKNDMRYHHLVFITPIGITSCIFSLLGILICYTQYRFCKVWQGLWITSGVFLFLAALYLFVNVDSLNQLLLQKSGKNNEWSKTSITLFKGDDDNTSKVYNNAIKDFRKISISGQIFNIPNEFSLGHIYSDGYLTYNDGDNEIKKLDTEIKFNQFADHLSEIPYLKNYKNTGYINFMQSSKSFKFNNTEFLKIHSEVFDFAKNKTLHYKSNMYVETQKGVIIGKYPYGEKVTIKKDNIMIKLNFHDLLKSHGINGHEIQLSLNHWSSNNSPRIRYKEILIYVVNSKEKEFLLTNRVSIGHPFWKSRVSKYHDTGPIFLDENLSGGWNPSEGWIDNAEVLVVLVKSHGYVKIPTELKNYTLPNNEN